MSWISINLWLIPALLLLAAGLTALLRQHQRDIAAALAIGQMTLAFFLSCAAFVETLRGEAAPDFRNFNWFQIGHSSLQLGWVLDPLTAVMLVMVTLVGLLIFIYSVGYMAHDENFTRFFCFLSLFAAAMLGLVIANSLLLLFICWEVVGLASYLLIGFWYHKPSAAAAAKKAFITTRIGDIGFFLGMVWLYKETGTLLFYDNGAGCLEQSALARLVAHTTLGGMAVSTAVALLIFCGAIGKSGQVPLHVWLPDAMEGPTPVSALIHAATMVAAGVFLVARVYPLIQATPEQFRAATAIHAIPLTPALSPSDGEREKRGQSVPQSGAPRLVAAREVALPLPVRRGEGQGEGEGARKPARAFDISTALKAVTWIGAITAVFAALIAVAQTDIKRILAYSTVSQLGFMFVGLGVGGVAVGMFHLLTHAFFKALLFLGAGSVIHGCHEEQDIRRMGGLRKFMPVTFATYAVGMMALSGFPLLFSGFWSKDEILHRAWQWPVSKGPFVLAAFGALLTAFYMTRQMCYVFFGSRRTGAPPVSNSEEHLRQAGRLSYEPHESPPVMTIPLAILAVFAVLLGFLGTPAWPWFQSFLNGEPAHLALAHLSHALPTMLLSMVLVAAGVGLGWRLYGRKSVKSLQVPPRTRLATKTDRSGDILVAAIGEAGRQGCRPSEGRFMGSAEWPDVLEQRRPVLFRWLHGKFFVDEFYEATVVSLHAVWAKVCDLMDRWFWGELVDIVALLTQGVSQLSRLFDKYVINLGFDAGCRRITGGGKLMSALQDGQVQNYLRVLALALVALVLALVWGW